MLRIVGCRIVRSGNLVNKKSAIQRISKSSLFSSASSSSSSSSSSATGNPRAIMTKRLRSLKDIVHNLEVRESLPFIGNGAYLALVSGFLMTDMLHLRVALVGGYTGLVAFHALHPKPLKIPLLWSAVFVVVNAGAAVLLATDRWTGPLSPGDEALYSEHFTRLSRGQFYQLLSLGQRQEIPDGTVLTKEGQVCSKLYFIKKGTAKVYHHEAFAANVDEGGFVNDVAFQQGEIEGAYGTIVTDGDCSVIIWDQKILRDYLASRSDMDRNTKYLLSEHLMRSLLKQREARRWNQKTNGSGILQSVGDIR